MRALLDVLLAVLNLLTFLLVIYAVLSWLIAFNVVNARNQVVATIYRVCEGLTAPLVRPIRRIIPPINGLDLSLLVLLLIIFFLQRFIILYIYPAVP